MPMSAEKKLKDTQILEVLNQYLSDFNHFLSAYRDNEKKYLSNHPGTSLERKILSDIAYTETISNETDKFVEFLSAVLKTESMEDNVYVQKYRSYVNDYNANQQPVQLPPARYIFNEYMNALASSHLNLSLSLLRVEEFPRNICEYITDTIRAVLHYLDKLITWMTCRSQTMREGSTPFASFLGKKHFIEPSARKALQEKLDQIFANGKPNLMDNMLKISNDN
ncbi:MAG: hypothetical protein ACO1N3_02005 [Gammaproteobacteria bacterium]